MGQEDQGVAASAGRYHVVPRTLCFVTHNDCVLLLKGAPDKPIWANRYNGLGGHIERSEDVYTSALREICEEAGWEARNVQNLCLRGIVNVDAGDPQTGIMLFIFTAQVRRPEVRPSREGTLEWIPFTQLANYDLVEDIPVLLSRLLSTSQSASGSDDAPVFFAHYAYDEQDQLVINFRD